MVEFALLVVMALAGLAVLLVPARDLRLRGIVVVLAVLLIGAIAAGARLGHGPRAGTADDPANSELPLAAKYDGHVSSQACASCHPDQYASWYRSYHRTMTQVVTPETMLADWPGVQTIHGKRYVREQDDDRYYVGFNDARGAPVRERVLMATGSHHQQVYWIAGNNENELRILPFTWLVPEQEWVPYEDTFLKPFTGGEPGLVWSSSCIHCHSTGGQPLVEVAPETLATRIGELGIACEACHGPGEEHVRANHNAVRRYGKHLDGGDDETIVNPRKLATDRANMVCGKCHGMMAMRSQALAESVKKIGETYRPGEDLNETRKVMRRPKPTEPNRWPRFVDFDTFTWPDGQIRNSGRDYNGIVESECGRTGELSCLSCHSMHNWEDRNDQLKRGMDGDEACLQCHDDLRGRVAEHSHHPAESSGARCYNCHMPHTTYGLLKAIRSHTLGRSPSVTESVEAGRPNACNLCHLDKSLGWTGRHLEEWYGAPEVELPTEEDETRSAALLWLMRGDAYQRTLVAWHMGWPPAVEASGDAWIAPMLSLTLDDSYSAVRYIGGRSLLRLPGFEEFEYDYVAPSAERRKARQRVWELWQSRTKGSRLDQIQDAALFLGPDLRFDEAAIVDTMQRRNNRPVTIAE